LRIALDYAAIGAGVKRTVRVPEPTETSLDAIHEMLREEARILVSVADGLLRGDVTEAARLVQLEEAGRRLMPQWEAP
jgi:hypothetical protein